MLEFLFITPNLSGSSMPGRLLLALLLFASFSWSETFDKPVRRQRVELGKAANPLSDRHRVTCYFFPNFMVKEIDLGEVGAERLAIVPVTPQSAGKCTRVRSKEEIVIPVKEWSGYFMGVKSGYVFFSGDDGWNGATPFAVFDAKTGKKLFEDSAKADIAFLTKPDQTIAMQYLRVVSDDCLILKDAACWQRMAAKYGLDTAAPDCRKGYAASADSMAKERCSGKPGPLAPCLNQERPLALQQAYDSPSVISYPVEVELGATPSIKATGTAAACWPAD
jgi:hypothetical protein